MGLFDRFRHPRERPKVTLVLGGGSARGIAHIGVLKVLEREKVPIDAVVGTSIGALIGAAYAMGVPLSQLEEWAYRFTWDKLFDPTIPRMALLEGKKLENVIVDVIGQKGFGDSRIPLHIVATNIETNEEIAYSAGDLVKAIRASCSWPVIFNPVEMDGSLLVDGGIKNSVPTKIAKMAGAEFIIASDVGFCVRKGKMENIIQIMVQTLQIMGEELNRYQGILADIKIRPRLGDIDQAAFHRSREAVKRGEEAAEEVIGDIRKSLGV